jgi:hypothetical protein
VRLVQEVKVGRRAWRCALCVCADARGRRPARRRRERTRPRLRPKLRRRTVRAPLVRPRAPTQHTSDFLAQHTKGPGLLTLTGTTLSFAPAAGSSARLALPRAALRGAKKADLLGAKGLSLRFAPDGGAPGERVERFLWVRGRDELFARLVAGDERWRSV